MMHYFSIFDVAACCLWQEPRISFAWWKSSWDLISDICFASHSATRMLVMNSILYLTKKVWEIDLIVKLNVTVRLLVCAHTETDALPQCKEGIAERWVLTHRVLRPLRPLNMRPWTACNLFPVSRSSRMPPAPSNTPSRISRSLLLLRFLEWNNKQSLSCFKLLT